MKKHYHTSFGTAQPETTTASDLFENWFDPIEAGLRVGFANHPGYD